MQISVIHAIGNWHWERPKADEIGIHPRNSQIGRRISAGLLLGCSDVTFVIIAVSGLAATNPAICRRNSSAMTRGQPIHAIRWRKERAAAYAER
jgi:C4-dicarboxylate transporter